MNRALFCLLSAVSLAAVSITTVQASTSASSESASELIEPLEEYLDMMEVGSPLTAQVYVVTSQGVQTWNNSVTYCQTTFSTLMNSNCYLAELLTAQQVKSLGTQLIGNNWYLWVGAYWKPLRNGQSQWVWYHTGVEITSPDIWMYGYPLSPKNGGSYVATANSFLTWGSVLQNGLPPTTLYYFACTCY